MLVKEAIEQYRAQIEAEESKREQLRLEAEREAAAARQRWIDAMRERIQLQYGLELTDEDVSHWALETYGDRYLLYWVLPNGIVRPDRELRYEDVTPPGRQWYWNATHNVSVRRDGFGSLIHALTFAETGKWL